MLHTYPTTYLHSYILHINNILYNITLPTYLQIWSNYSFRLFFPHAHCVAYFVCTHTHATYKKTNKQTIPLFFAFFILATRLYCPCPWPCPIQVISHVADNRKLILISVFSASQNVQTLPPGITWRAAFHLVQILRPPKNCWLTVMVITAMAKVVQCPLRHRPQYHRPLRTWR